MSLPKPLVSFYNQIGFAPTRQQLSSHDTLSARRAFLYQSLGIPNIAVRGSDIIEFGPGSGENSDILIAQIPKSYKFVDGSEAVLTSLQDKIGFTAPDSTARPHFMFTVSDILEYKDDARYDLVICEGVLMGQLKPREMATHVLPIGGSCVTQLFPRTERRPVATGCALVALVPDHWVDR